MFLRQECVIYKIGNKLDLLPIVYLSGSSNDELINILKYKMDFFVRFFRKKQSLSKKVDESIRHIAIDKAEKVLEIEDVLNVSPNCIPDFGDIEVRTFADVEKVAVRFRQELGLGNSPIPNVYILLDAIGVKVFPMKLDERFDALNFSYDSEYFVMVNTTLESNERVRFTLLHEVGHIIMNIPDDISDKMVEKLCHRFACNVLLPPDVLKSKIGQKRVGIALQELAHIQSEYGISIKAIMVSAKDQGIITDGNLTSFYKKTNASQDFKNYVDRSRFCQEEAESGFTSMVYRALASEIISTSKAAFLLGDSVNNVVNHISML